MSTPVPALGSIAWCDLTTEVAERLRTFYERVVGWSAQPVDMGTYADFNMLDESGTPAAGVCHAKGFNVDLPTVWLIYVTVEDLEESLARCVEEGGTVLVPARSMGTMGQFAVIADPSGAPIALFESAPSAA
jgi:predicted enzyme related to lactoylglutathione lyase